MISNRTTSIVGWSILLAIFGTMYFLMFSHFKHPEYNVNREKVEFTQEMIKILEKSQIKDIFTHQCIVTAYSSAVEQTDSTPYKTALMERPITGWTCAVSRDLLHWLGGRIYIKGIGVQRVNDLMNKRFNKSIDLYMDKLEDAKKFGRRQLIVVFLGKDCLDSKCTVIEGGLKRSSNAYYQMKIKGKQK